MTVAAITLPPRTLFTFALEREAAPFRRLCPLARFIIAGAGSINAHRVLDCALSSASADLVVSVGFAGGLSRVLAVGSVVVANRVVDVATQKELTSTWPVAGVPARIAAVDKIISTSVEKADLASRLDAAAADMETLAIANICHQRGLPWLAIRVISDDAATALSPELLALLSGGSVSPWQAIRLIFRQPHLIKEMRRLAKDTRLAADRLAEYLGACWAPAIARQS